MNYILKNGLEPETRVFVGNYNSKELAIQEGIDALNNKLLEKGYGPEIYAKAVMSSIIPVKTFKGREIVVKLKEDDLYYFVTKE